MKLPVSRLLLDQGEELDLEVCAGEAGLENLLVNGEWSRPGLALAGFVDVFAHDRVQILGNTETSYLSTLGDAERRERIHRILQYPIPCIIVTNGNECLPEFIEACNETRLPLLRSSLPTSLFCSLLGIHLEREFAPTMSVHGVFVDVFGLGVLIMGGSGVGKSEVALELIERGHRLIADDAVVLQRLGKNVLMGRALNDIQHHMELRGLGFVDVELLFGFGSVREEMRVSLVVELVKRQEGAVEERFSETERTIRFIGVDVHQYVVPVESGRNMSIIVEVAALHHRILSHGRDPQRELNEQLIRQMSRAKFHRR